jgi:hypothetical protein
MVSSKLDDSNLTISYFLLFKCNFATQYLSHCYVNLQIDASHSYLSMHSVLGRVLSGWQSISELQGLVVCEKVGTSWVNSM